MNAAAPRPAQTSAPRSLRRFAALAVLTLVFATVQAIVLASPAQAAIGFGKSVLAGANAKDRATTVQFGPDGRLYVLHQDGTIFMYRIARNGPNNYHVTSTASTTLIKNNIPNHNDNNGAVNNSFVANSCTAPCRMATGMVVTGTAAQPVIHVSSSDPRFGNQNTGDTNLDTNSGMISRLNWTGTSWVKTDLVRGLPRSEENHASNGMVLDQATNTIYLAAGGHTNQGAPDRAFNFLPEYALSAAVLSIDLDAIGNTTYNIPTLDDPSRTNSAPGVDVNDPFGGNNGANQARIVPGGPVQVYSPGYRNPYDLLVATVGSHAGKMYVTDNGYNAGQGGRPPGEGTPDCTNAIASDAPTTGFDSLHHVTGPGYYGGHPNPTRGNTANTFGGQSPVPASEENPIECDFQTSLGDDPTPERPAIGWDPSSTNGIVEYTASNFGGEMRGDLIAAEWDGYVNRYHLNAPGTAVLSTSRLFSDVSVHPLDLTTTGDTGPFPGTIWLADHVSGSIFVFEPNDFGGGGATCTGADNPALEEDGDGYTNADEIDNGTSPCSAGDVPRDWDNDRVSNLNDPDDDNDSMPDTSDPWAIDGANGTTTMLPVNHPFDDTDASAGGLLNLGFTGLMTNGTANYESLYDPNRLTAGGNGGVLTVDTVGPGDAAAPTDTQQYAFQYGFQLASARGAVFTPHTRVIQPFAGITPTGSELVGMQLGTGDQDNYVRLAVSGSGGTRSVVLRLEVAGSVVETRSVNATIPSSGLVDLFLAVDPANQTVQPSFQVTEGTTAGPRTNLGTALALPAAWFSRAALATGVIATSGGGQTFPATWDFFEIQSQAASQFRPDARVRLSTVTALTGNNVYNATGANQTVNTTAGRRVMRTFVVNVQNDGTGTDSFILRGPGNSAGFSVAYFAGTTNITTAVVAGTYRQNGVPAGGTRAIRMRVTVASGAAIGAVKSSLVTATSANSGTVADTIRTIVTVG
jgi:hypothetical protein